MKVFTRRSFERKYNQIQIKKFDEKRKKSEKKLNSRADMNWRSTMISPIIFGFVSFACEKNIQFLRSACSYVNVLTACCWPNKIELFRHSAKDIEYLSATNGIKSNDSNSNILMNWKSTERAESPSKIQNLNFSVWTYVAISRRLSNFKCT